MVVRVKKKIPIRPKCRLQSKREAIEFQAQIWSHTYRGVRRHTCQHDRSSFCFELGGLASVNKDIFIAVLYIIGNFMS